MKNLPFPDRITRKQIRSFSLLLAFIIIIFALFTENYHLLFLLVPVLVGFFYQPILYVPAYVWYTFSAFAGFVFSKLMLTVSFLLLVIPVGFIRRFSGKDDLYIHRQTGSTFKEREHKYIDKDLDKTF